VITEGVTPSLHVDYKRSRIKQYHKEGQALRTETTINDTRDFGIGRLLHNRPALLRVGFAANRRLLEVERVSDDCALGEEAFQDLQHPRQIAGQRVPALRFADPQVQALLHALLMFVFIPQGFTSKELRHVFAVLLGKRSGDIKPGRMSYELRRLRLHGLIERIPKSHRYRLTDHGLRTAMFYTTPACTRAYCVRVSPSSLHTTTRHQHPLCIALSRPPRKPSFHGATTLNSPHNTILTQHNLTQPLQDSS
jgi:hypothetical protein